MAKIKISAETAVANAYGGFSVVFDLTGKPAPIAPRVIEVKATKDALAALAEYKQEAAKTGLPLAVSMRLIEGRAPNGSKAATSGFAFYHGINV